MLRVLRWDRVRRNAALGHGDAGDRLYPDQVLLSPQNAHAEPEKQTRTLKERFEPIRAKQVVMSKLHTSAYKRASRR